MDAAWIAALGAFLSGIGSVFGAIASARITRRKEREECDRRVKELRASFDRGLRLRKTLQEEDFEDRWSGLQ